MQSSAIVAFAVGAALASGIVYVTVKPKPETLIRVESPVIAEQPLPQVPNNAEREKPSPVARVLLPPAAVEPVKKSPKKPEPEKRLEIVKVSPPLTARLEPVSRVVPQPAPTTYPVKADLPAQPPQPEPAQEAPAPATEPTPVPAAPPLPPPPAANTVTIRAGANLNVRVGETLSTRRSRVGDNFLATLTDPLVIDGWVIAERGARVEGRVVDSDPGGRAQGTAHLSVELVRLTTSDGQRIRIQTQPIDRKANPSTGDMLLIRVSPAEIPVEMRLGFRVVNSVEITEQKQQR
jgi:hypothetical protein